MWALFIGKDRNTKILYLVMSTIGDICRRPTEPGETIAMHRCQGYSGVPRYISLMKILESTDLLLHKNEIAADGFAIIENIFSETEINSIIETINKADTSKPTFRKTSDLFAIRQFLKEIPEVIPYVFTGRLNSTIKELFGDDCFVVKSIYFDKPGESNWFVSYHQDLTISVDKKMEIDGFGPWTMKQNQFAVQPPLEILESNFTVRIHLDDTDENNGALRVIPGSHLKGIYRPENIDWAKEKETVCSVPKGGMMIMRPLLLHASSRTTNNKKRRVVHIEFSNSKLPEELNWSEQFQLLIQKEV